MDSTTQKLVNDALLRSAKGVISEKNEGLNILQQQINNLSASLADAQNELKKKTEELEEAEDAVEFYNNLLCQPMSVIAKKNVNFKETYEKQMELMADWMVSQKAFKQLAIELGGKNGLSVEEVLKIGKDKEIDVLESKHPEGNNTNANNSSIIRPYINNLVSKFRDHS